jgi:phosphoribosylformylglycinamidine synthase subunit PurQ / glutaminase
VSGATRISVITFPGSNDDGDAILALELLGAEPVRAWHAETTLPAGTTGVVLPGGFSYGDYLRCGAIARFAPVMEAVDAFAASGGPVLGICNGFQILCEAGLLPGVLRLNRQQQFLCRDVTVTVASTTSAFAGEWEAGQELVIPIKHGEGNWYGSPELVASLEAQGQIVFRYVDDVNGAVGKVAGVTNEAGNVLGLMPHPEHAVDELLGPTGGVAVLGGLIAAARAPVAVGARTPSL